MVDVEVEFDYDAELPDELTIRSGQLITDVKQMDGGWWEGTLKGKRGVFPDNFVKVVSKSDMKAQQKPSLSLSSSVDDGLNDDESDDIDSEVKLRPKLQTSSSKSGPIAKRQCRVLFSYAPAHEDELELQMDEVIDFLGEVEDGWWRGALNGKTGVFPSNFVEMVNSPGTGEPSLKTPPAVENILESKNKKNDPNLKEPARVDIVEASRAKISNLIQEAESKAKPGRLPISAFENKPSNSASPKKEAQSRPSFALGLVASLGGGKTNVTPVSAVNTVVIENHNLLKKSTKPASNDPAQHPLKGAERRQSPLGRESNPDLKNSTSSTSSNNVSNISAPRLPPKPVPRTFSCSKGNLSSNRKSFVQSSKKTLNSIPPPATPKPLPKFQLEEMSFPLQTPIHRVDQNRLAQSEHQLEFHLSWDHSSASAGHFVSHGSEISEPRRKRGFFRRLSMSLRSLTTTRRSRAVSLRKHHEKWADDSISMTSLPQSEKRRSSTTSLKGLFQKISPSKWIGNRSSTFNLQSQESIIHEKASQAASLPFLFDLPNKSRRRPRPHLNSLPHSKIRRFQTLPDLQTSFTRNEILNQSRGCKSSPRRNSRESIKPAWRALCASFGDLGSNTSGSTESFDYYIMNGRQNRAIRQGSPTLPTKYQFKFCYEPERYQVPRHRRNEGKLLGLETRPLVIHRSICWGLSWSQGFLKTTLDMT